MGTSFRIRHHPRVFFFFFCNKCSFAIVSLSLLFVATDGPKEQMTAFLAQLCLLPRCVERVWRGVCHNVIQLTCFCFFFVLFISPGFWPFIRVIIKTYTEPKKEFTLNPENHIWQTKTTHGHQGARSLFGEGLKCNLAKHSRVYST